MKSIKKILIPTDFSATSASAFEFGTKLADLFDAEVAVLNVYSDEFIAPTPHQIRKTILSERKENAIHCCIDFALDDPPNVLQREDVSTSTKVHTYVRKGKAGPEIVHFANREKIDLIVMGTKNEHSLKEKLLGSVSTYVSGNSSVPVLLIPEDAKFNDIRKVLYASDLSGVDLMDLEIIKCWTDKFHAELHWVHVNVGNQDYELNSSEIEKIVQINGPDLKVIMSEVSCNSVIEGLEQYTKQKYIDIIIMHRGKKQMLDLILKGSQTRKMAFRTSIPLLVLSDPCEISWIS